MKKIFNNFKIYSREILIISLSTLLLIYTLKSYKKEIEVKYTKENLSYQLKVNNSLQNQVDSLKTELFILEVENTRHEITREHIFSTYPKVGKEYDFFISHYTE